VQQLKGHRLDQGGEVGRARSKQPEHEVAKTGSASAALKSPGLSRQKRVAAVVLPRALSGCWANRLAEDTRHSSPGNTRQSSSPWPARPVLHPPTPAETPDTLAARGTWAWQATPRALAVAPARLAAREKPGGAQAAGPIRWCSWRDCRTALLLLWGG
jgi:hypothetical protein